MPREVVYWNNIDITGYLKKKLWIGQIDPWRRHDNGDPVLCLLTDVDPALKEIQDWIGPGHVLSRTEFVKNLQDNLVFVFRSTAEFEKIKKEHKEVDTTPLKPKRRRILSEEHREKLRIQLEKVRPDKKQINH